MGLFKQGVRASLVAVLLLVASCSSSEPGHVSLPPAPCSNAAGCVTLLQRWFSPPLFNAPNTAQMRLIGQPAVMTKSLAVFSVWSIPAEREVGLVVRRGGSLDCRGTVTGATETFCQVTIGAPVTAPHINRALRIGSNVLEISGSQDAVDQVSLALGLPTSPGVAQD